MYSIKLFSEKDFPKELIWDSSFKLLFILNGNMDLQVGASERHLNIHDFTFIKPFELYGGCSSANGCSVFLIDVFSDTWSIICPDAQNQSFSIQILKPTDKYSAYNSICKSLSKILYYSTSNEDYSTVRTYSSISDIIAVLIEDFSSGTADSKSSEIESSRIRQITQFIRDNYTRKLPLEETANEIGFHPQYFSAYFKKKFRTNYSDYLNTYRINKSVNQLTDSNESILNIALSCGFNNHKTFSNAFEKVYGCSPREYRKKSSSLSKIPEEDINSEDFDYLRKFWSKNNADTAAASETQKYCKIIIKNRHSEKINSSHNIISIGRAISCLRSDMQQQIKLAKDELNLEFARIRDIFSDDLFIYYEDKNKASSYSWRTLDQIFDFLLSVNLKPFIEIGYMPEQLALKKQHAGWQYHPNVSVPKSYKLWEQFIENFITHLYSRYGKSCVNSWIFDFWTSPNIQVTSGYWNETIETFFQFYDITYKTIKRIAPDIRFGSPNFSFPSGFNYYNQFFDYAVKHGIKADFLSMHLYSCGDGLDTSENEFAQYYSFEKNNLYHFPNVKPVRENIPAAVSKVKELLAAYSFPDLPIVIDDWNVTFFPTDYTRDTCFMAPFIIENYFNCYDKIFGMGFASLSDVHEDFFNTDQLFGGGPGLQTYNGIPKAAYLALKFAYNFPRRIYKKGENYIVGEIDNGYEILIYNMDFYSDDYIGNNSSVISYTQRYNVFNSVPDLNCHIELPANNTEYTIVKTLLSRQNGSSYDKWLSMGAPSHLTPEMVKYLQQTSLPSMNYRSVHADNSLIMDEILEPHSVLHIKITEKLL